MGDPGRLLVARRRDHAHDVAERAHRGAVQRRRARRVDLDLRGRELAGRLPSRVLLLGGAGRARGRGVGRAARRPAVPHTAHRSQTRPVRRGAAGRATRGTEAGVLLRPRDAGHGGGVGG